MGWIEDRRLDKNFWDIRYKCKCGHPVYISANKDSVLCTVCGHLVFKSKEAEFKRRLLSQLKRCGMNEKTNNIRIV